MEEGVECIVELVNNSKGLVAITKSRIEHVCRIKCAKMLSKIINFAIQAKEEFCHSIRLKQYLMPLDAKDITSYKDRDKLFDLRDVERVLREGKDSALSITRTWPVKLSCLLHLREYLVKGEQSISESS